MFLIYVFQIPDTKIFSIISRQFLSKMILSLIIKMRSLDEDV